MKKFLILTLSAVLLLTASACGAAQTPAEPEGPAQPEIAAEEEKKPVEQTIFSSWDDFSPQETASTPDPGETKENWDLSRADAYPEDDDCSEAEFFEKWMTVEGLTTDDLDARGCRQLIIAALRKDSQIATTTICYEKQEDGSWAQAEGFERMRGSVGRRGVSHDRHAGDETSPGGIWQIGTAFGNEEKPEGLKMPWRDVTPNSYWIGDDSKYYNTWQESDDPDLPEIDFDEGEHLCEYTESYALAAVVRFNMAPHMKNGHGSAIFFHVSRGATAGCIGLPYDNFRKTLLWLDPDMNPYMLVTGYENETNW